MVALIRKLKKVSILPYRFLLLDECFSQVYGDRLPLLSEFINNLCKEYEFIVLLISQNHDFKDYADNPYQLELVDKELVIAE